MRRIERLDKVIREELLEPRTVYVTESEHFAQDWKVFQKVMKSLPTPIGFVASERDESIFVRFNWQIQRSYDGEKFSDYMWLRALALRESGMFGLWTKWDGMRREFKERENVEIDRDFVPLSFEHSDIHLHFWLWLGCLLIASVVLSAEILIHLGGFVLKRDLEHD